VPTLKLIVKAGKGTLRIVEGGGEQFGLDLRELAERLEADRIG
jgi:hypothetical protein